MKQKRMLAELDEQNYKKIREIAFKNDKTIKMVTNYLIKKGLEME